MLKLLASDWYAPPSGHGAEFEIRGLNYREMAEIREMIGAQDRGARDPAIHERALEMALTGWRGVDHDFEPGLIARLPEPIVDEISAEIFNRSALTAEQEKNLSSPSTSRRREKSSTAAPAASAAPAKNRAARRAASAGKSKRRAAKSSS